MFCPTLLNGLDETGPAAAVPVCRNRKFPRCNGAISTGLLYFLQVLTSHRHPIPLSLSCSSPSALTLRSTAMEFNATAVPSSDAWSGYLAEAQKHLSSRMIILALINIPVMAVVLNVLKQLVRMISLVHVHSEAYFVSGSAEG